MTAFPTLPSLPSIPEIIDPDAWLQAYHGRIYKRRVSASGAVMVDTYHSGRRYAANTIALHLDAQNKQLHVVCGGQRLKSLALKGLRHEKMTFSAYLDMMMVEARSIEQHLRRKAQQRVAFA